MTDEPVMVECPRCHGAGGGVDRSCDERGWFDCGESECDQCFGSGEITVEEANYLYQRKLEQWAAEAEANERAAVRALRIFGMDCDRCDKVLSCSGPCTFAKEGS